MAIDRWLLLVRSIQACYGKPLVRSIQKLKKREDIAITKPGKGSGVVVMDKFEYIRLLNEASIDDVQNSDPLASKSEPQEEDHQNITIRF